MHRQESALVRRFREHLRREGHSVQRLRVVPPGESAPLFSDLWDESAGELIEAKATVSREHVRTAVGQLLDYGRFVEHQRLTILLPSRPREDLLSFVANVGIGVVYPEGPDSWMRIQ